MDAVPLSAHAHLEERSANGPAIVPLDDERMLMPKVVIETAEEQFFRATELYGHGMNVDRHMGISAARVLGQVLPIDAVKHPAVSERSTKY